MLPFIDWKTQYIAGIYSDFIPKDNAVSDNPWNWVCRLLTFTLHPSYSLSLYFQEYSNKMKMTRMGVVLTSCGMKMLRPDCMVTMFQDVLSLEVTLCTSLRFF